MKATGFIAIVLLFPAPAIAGNIYVNNQTGSDINTGSAPGNAFLTIRKAVSVVKPGDTVHLANTGFAYKESLVLNDLNGKPDQRITIDGHGATLSGCQPLDLNQWQQVAPGLYKNSVFYRVNRFVGDFTRIYFFLFNGEICRMGRSRKGPCAAFKEPAALKDNEWTFTENDSTFYVKINPAKRLADCNIEQPVRSNAVAVTGTTSYITVRNLICTHVFNDGFGLTGTPHHLVFKNIQSHYCGDDGISAHASSQFDVYGFVSIGNATGIADSGNSFTSYDGVVIKDCVGMDLFFVNERSGEAAHSLKNVLVLCNAANPVVITTQKPDGHMDIKMKNVMVIGNRNRDTMIRMDGQSELYTEDCSFMDLNLLLKGKSATMNSTIIGGTNNFIARGNSWSGKSNVYRGEFVVDSITYSQQQNNISAYRKKTQDWKSIWLIDPVMSTPVRKNGLSAGADMNSMPLHNQIMKDYFLAAMQFRNR